MTLYTLSPIIVCEVYQRAALLCLLFYSEICKRHWQCTAVLPQWHDYAWQ